MSTQLTIRASRNSDIAAVTALLGELNREEGYEHSASSEAIAAMFADGRLRMRALVAEVQEGVVGVLLYYWGYDTVSASFGFHLADIIVSRHARNRGIGGALYRALAKQVLEEGGQWISLTVLKKNHEARRFYAAMGMTEVAVDFFAIGPVALARCSQTT